MTLPSAKAWKPTRVQLAAAHGKTVPDVIGSGLNVLFCGINPGLYSAAVGHHFARPGNRFWPALHQAGFTPRLFSPFEERELLSLGYGITNVVARATGSADELAVEDFRTGACMLEKKVARFHPRIVAFVGVGAYRLAFARPQAALGPQDETLAGAALWVLPNPSGLNAHHQLADLVRLFRALHEASAARARGPAGERGRQSAR
jgi:double-stranded uracil-DNA glycosylase